jgi:beta-N-acetylhexosaminidase
MTRALIIGVSGTELTAQEGSFLKAFDPWGLILFKRNIEHPQQVKALTEAFRKAVSRPDAPILVDQEGGRVQRLTKPHWPLYPTGETFGRIGRIDPESAKKAAYLGAYLIGIDLISVGISVDCLPVLDIPVAGAHDVIGDRAYGRDAETVSVLGRAAAEGLMASGVIPIMKHIPGHGRAGVDSHLDLPIVDAPLSELETDFIPFKANADLPMAMTAHVVYEAIDPQNPATTSKTVIDTIIRGKIGFDGLLMGDDVSMQALKGPIAERATASLAAGCDVVLHCNGHFDEMQDLAAVVPELTGKALQRAEKALLSAQKSYPQRDLVDARAEFASLLALAG